MESDALAMLIINKHRAGIKVAEWLWLLTISFISDSHVGIFNCDGFPLASFSPVLIFVGVCH